MGIAKPLSDLFDLGKILRRRDEIVIAAHQYGATADEIRQITGLARTTVSRILGGDSPDAEA